MGDPPSELMENSSSAMFHDSSALEDRKEMINFYVDATNKNETENSIEGGQDHGQGEFVINDEEQEQHQVDERSRNIMNGGK
jgi:hypothetical protein